ncbi:hypothetical protein MSMEI_4517 [Mycolicibacterium smegmatis MC2 155]|uniref:Uncharacterized protein n=1 Tax=Mycolicibacterium smegmatis (strain ATCC 700084 / mc(2)155) TaxID=246196 RepID=I7GCL5_MYCS2|nr:hypothetical protein MSMEI_4517 [Mycolicibacterium smegmatis MC2 155]
MAVAVDRHGRDRDALGVRGGGNLGEVQALLLDFLRDAQQPNLLESQRNDVRRDEAQSGEHRGADRLAPQRDGRVATGVRVAVQEDAGHQQRVQADAAVHGNRTNHVVDLELLQQPADERSDRTGTERDDEGQRRVVQIHARGDADDTAQTTRDGPERFTLGCQVGADDATAQAHQGVECERAHGRRARVDGRQAVARVDDAAHQEAEEAREDEHQAQHGQRQVVRTDGHRGAVGQEASDTRTEVDQNAEGREARDHVDAARGTHVMEAQLGQHPAGAVPAPRGADYPGHRTDEHCENEESAGADAFEHRAGHDRPGGRGEQRERAPEDAAGRVLDVGPHVVAPRERSLGCLVELDEPAGHRVVEEPADEVEGRDDGGQGQQVLHRGGKHVLRPGCADLVGEEPRVDEEHQRDGHPVVELVVDRRHRVEGVLYVRWHKNLRRGKELKGVFLRRISGVLTVYRSYANPCCVSRRSPRVKSG